MVTPREWLAELTMAQIAALLAAEHTVDGRWLVGASPVVGDLWPRPLVRYYSARRDVLSEEGVAVRMVLLDVIVDAIHG